MVAILLGHLKKDAAEVRKALLSMDEQLLTPQYDHSNTDSI